VIEAMRGVVIAKNEHHLEAATLTKMYPSDVVGWQHLDLQEEKRRSQI